MGNLFSDLWERFKVNNNPGLKKLIIVGGGVLFLLLLMVVSNRQSKKNPAVSKVSLMPLEAKKPKRELNYEFIKFDTVKIPSFAPAAEKSFLDQPLALEPPPAVSRSWQSGSIKQSTHQANMAKANHVEPLPSSEPLVIAGDNVNRNPNMIIMNNMGENQLQSGGSPSTFSGRQSVLIKLVLPNRTPVGNGSLVEARVLHESHYGNLTIPRRAKLIGVASLFNRRVDIQWQEIIINEVSHSCSGRAYDLKRLQGLPYSPVSIEAKRVLLEELRDAVSGIPVVGRVANRASTYNDFNQEVAELEEGLEFYGFIESIY
ncbi:MAG: hypothetical protein ONB27_02745 [candidate division KSB1 bacterium]|nr:hypothetical protein [candidate division KSB1 bacterium]